jgi:hypothetical protein
MVASSSAAPNRVEAPFILEPRRVESQRKTTLPEKKNWSFAHRTHFNACSIRRDIAALNDAPPCSYIFRLTAPRGWAVATSGHE